MSNPLEVKVYGILSFADLFTPYQKSPKDTPKYKASILIDPDSKQGKKSIEALEEAQDLAIKQKWPTKPPKLSGDKKVLRDGNEKEWDGYEGMKYISASNKRPPTVVDNNRNRITEDDNIIYNGCKVVAIVRVWAQDDPDYGKRVNASLEGIQYAGKGVPFGAPPLSESAFDDLGDLDDEDEDDAPRAKSKKRPVEDDEDDEKPVSKAKKKKVVDEDDDEEEAPRSKSKKRLADDDDDEEEAPRAKKKKKVVDDEDDED